MSTDIQSIVFDYGDLPAEKVMECEAAHQAACSIENQAVILIGEQFAKVKENLKYLRNGNGFVEWCEKRAGITLQTAHNYINTYEQRESIKLFDAFGKTALFMLAAPSTPQEVRDKASAIAADGGDVSVKAIKQLKAEHAKELAEEKRRNEDWRQQSNGQRQPAGSGSLDNTPRLRQHISQNSSTHKRTHAGTVQFIFDDNQSDKSSIWIQVQNIE